MLIELILNLGAVIAIVLFTRSILLSTGSTRSQVTLAIFLLGLGLHLLAKELAWMWPARTWLQIPTYVLASCLPLLLALHFEALLRRHFHRRFKIYLVSGTAIAMAFSFAFAKDRTNPLFETVFGLFVLGFALQLSWTLFTRSESDLSPGENAVLNATTVGFLVLFAFLASELPIFQSIRELRIGGLGCLVFLYICIRIHGVRDNKRRILARVLSIFACCAAFSTVACLGLYEDLPYQSFLRLWSLSTLTFLGYLSFDHLQRHALRHNEDLFLTWLASANATNLPAFLEALKSWRSDSEVVLINEESLTELRRDSLLELFLRHSFLSKRDLRGLPPSEGLDQAYHLMETVGVNAVILIRQEPLTFLGMNVAQGGGTPRARHELSVIRKICVMLEEQGHADPA